MTRSDFRALRRCRRVRRVGAGEISVSVYEAPASPGVRVGSAVGRAVGDSVVRHRVQRRVRAAAAAVLRSGGDGATPGSPGRFVVVRVGPGGHDVRVPDLELLLRRALRPDTAATSSAISGKEPAP